MVEIDSLVGLSFGLGAFVAISLCGVGLISFRRNKVRLAELEANELLAGVKADVEAEAEKQKEEMEEVCAEMFKRVEKDFERMNQKNEQLKEKIEDREAAAKEASNLREDILKRKESSLQSRKAKLDREQTRINGLRERLKQSERAYLEAIGKRSSVTPEILKEQAVAALEQEASRAGQLAAQEIEQNMQVQAEREARRIIGLAINRFARPYCPERGIGNVHFETVEVMDKVLGKDREWLKVVEKLCGVDIVINQEYLSASIMGFDPVRRELGRLLLETLLRQNSIDAKRIEDLYNRVKSDLFKKILVDGNRIANELRLSGMHESVRHMLGALRYRYSFAQNQYFHVAEVGWLGGLLSSELGIPIPDGRRAGLLHDIGKAMDHSKEGGHAVIGADFIEQHGEAPHVVHAVRAHHYDETPSTDLAYLTIAADAISGARPGARRSTMDSYTQKMADLEKIGSSFEGVTATYILSAGREVRVMVDGMSIDDHKALQLSKDIAQKIEEECNYPGLIKVTVVRETQAVEYAR